MFEMRALKLPHCMIESNQNDCWDRLAPIAAAVIMASKAHSIIVAISNPLEPPK